MRCREVGDIRHIPVPELFDQTYQPFSGNAGNRFFTRSVNRQDYQHVRIVKGTGKIFFQRLRSGKAVRLEYRHDASVAGMARGAERGHDFRWVVPVVIHDQDVRLFAFDLKSAIRVLECAQCRDDFF